MRFSGRLGWIVFALSLAAMAAALIVWGSARGFLSHLQSTWAAPSRAGRTWHKRQRGKSMRQAQL